MDIGIELNQLCTKTKQTPGYPERNATPAFPYDISNTNNRNWSIKRIAKAKAKGYLKTTKNTRRHGSQPIS